MITVYHHDQGRFMQTVVEEAPEALPKNTVWIDLFHPTKSDEQTVQRLISVEVPTREEMQEIEASSRLYEDEGALVMTMPILNKVATTEPEAVAVTFILANDKMVTVRNADPTPFSMFLQRIHRQPSLAATGEQALIGLLEQVADGLADILEGASAELEGLSREVFRASGSDDSTNFNEALHSIGHVGELAAKAKESLLNFTRLLLFLASQTGLKKDAKLRLKTLMRDARSIDEHATFLSAKVSFLLDATLGLINIEQNKIIKIFSVAAVAFLPPTLIASIYGMNFRFMPELEWQGGYALAIVLMIISAVIPFWYFRRKKWL